MKLHVSIATVSETHFEGHVDALIVPGVAGEMTILANHVPIITTLKEGSVTVITDKERKSFPVSNGVLEVSDNTATVLL
jgi:F-type H+-transporting ATPase subunit epsilon